MTLNITALWDALGWAILHSLWQGALIGLIVWFARSLVTDRRAWLRYMIGMGGLVATSAAFIATFIMLTFSRVQSGSPVAFASSRSGGSPTDLTLSVNVLPIQSVQGNLAEIMVPWLGMIWAVGFAFLSLQAYRAYATTRWLSTQGLSEAGPDWCARFTSLIQRSRTHQRVRLFISEHVSGPMTMGTLRPIVLVPVGFLTALPPAQVEAILLHELAHIRRHDFLFGLVQTAIRTILYFNPAVIIMSRHVDEDREQACDDVAVSVTGTPGDLVRGLAALRLGCQAPAMVMAADGGPLLTRLNRLMGRPVSRTASNRLTAATISALMLSTAACSTISMAHPHPPTAPEAPTLNLSDTVVRATTAEAMMVETPDIPPMPPMPAMPTIPAVPSLPVPVFGDYDDMESFEAAMEAWGTKMDSWGDVVESRFEGEWETRMEVWEDEMGDWGEALSEVYGDIDVEDVSQVGERVEREMQRMQTEMQRSQREWNRAQREQERTRKQSQRVAERIEKDRIRENARKTARADAESHKYSSPHRTHKITVDGLDDSKMIDINGQSVDMNAFRSKLVAALVKDDFVKAGDRHIKLELCSDHITIDGQTGTKAQAARYAEMFAAIGLDMDDSLTVKIKPDLMSLTLSGHGKKNVRKVSVGTFDHDTQTSNATK